MRKKQFRGNSDDVYEFTVYKGHVAANVKCHWFPRLPEDQKKKIDVLSKDMSRQHGTSDLLDHYYARVWEQTALSWWEWAQDEAKACGLGRIHSAGRQDGWLVTSMQSIDVDEMLEYTEYRCRHCDCEEEQHVNEKCLFHASTWDPVIRLAPSSKEKLDALAAYLDQVTDSIDGLADSMTAELCQLIDDEYASMPEDPKICPGEDCA